MQSLHLFTYKELCQKIKSSSDAAHLWTKTPALYLKRTSIQDVYYISRSPKKIFFKNSYISQIRQKFRAHLFLKMTQKESSGVQLFLRCERHPIIVWTSSSCVTQRRSLVLCLLVKDAEMDCLWVAKIKLRIKGNYHYN